MKSRYQTTENFRFTPNDEAYLQKFTKIQDQARSTMPSSIYSPFVLTHLKEMKTTKLFELMKTVPKGVIHHCHIDCCQDKQFYRQHIINDPIIYLTQDKKRFKIGTSEDALKNNRISMKQLRKTFENQDQMVDFVSNITMFNEIDHINAAKKQIGFWQLFEKKIQDFFTIYYSLKHFKLYLRHIFIKFLQNQYDRLEFRALIVKLSEYDENGNLIKIHDEKMFTQAMEEVYNEVKKQYPNFSLGVIFFGLLQWSQQKNAEVFTKVCQIEWDKTVGIDVVQEQGPSLQPYIKTMDEVLLKYPHLNYKKVLHAGDTRDFKNNNVQLAVKAGSVRIGHGSNIIQRLEFLPECKNVCFQISPVSGCFSGNRDDIRIGQGPILMSLGVPVSISPDDPGKFGYEDTTVDYFMAMISYNWSLKDLKLIGIYSINHAVCSQDQKKALIQSFNKKWDLWIQNRLKQNQGKK